MNKKLARVSQIALEIKPNNVMVFCMYVDYEDGSHQGLGGIPLNIHHFFTDYGKGFLKWDSEPLQKLLNTLGGTPISKILGKHVWVIGEGDGYDFQPRGVQALALDGSEETFILN